MAARKKAHLIEVTVLERLADGGWLFAFTAKNADDFHYAVSVLKQIPSGMRRWLPDEKVWWFSTPGMAQLRRLFVEVNEAVKALAQDEASTGDAPKDVTQAFAQLYLLPAAPMPVIKSAYRALANFYHPDHGGAHEAMLRINTAYEIACSWAGRKATGKAG